MSTQSNLELERGTAEVLAGVSTGLAASAGDQQQSRWYAAYTLPRHEKTVAEQLDARRVEAYLPVYDTLHKWKDRRARVQLPLFPGYVFVRIPLGERLRVLTVPSVLRIVNFGGIPAPLPDSDIESLRNVLAIRAAEPWPYVAPGKRVRIRSGPLQGLAGVVVRKKGHLRVIVSLDTIMRSIAVEVEAADLEPLAL
jgi:transcription antitermination factor NusG